MRNEETIKYFNQNELRQFKNALKNYRLEMEWDKTKKAYNIAVRNEALFLVMYFCALRVSEVAILEIGDFNAIGEEIYCRRLKSGRNNTLRIVDTRILQVLKRHIRINSPEKYLFENMRSKKGNGQTVTRSTLDYWMRFYCNLAGFKNTELYHCHTLRHTRAVNLANAGLDVREIQYWLGHNDSRSTEIYMKFTSQQQNAMYRKLMKNKKKIMDIPRYTSASQMFR